MRTPDPLPSGLSGFGFTVREARDAGLSPARLRGSGIQMLGRGLRAPKDRELGLAEPIRSYTRFSPGLPEPRLNAPIRDAAGWVSHTPDLSYPELKISIDYEGGGPSDAG